jgi:murein DD-endopeptidase MepM/ murein hydrolase activator NlpD
VVFQSFFATVRVAAGTFAAAAAIFGANPAFANSSANADIAAPLRAAQAARPATSGAGEEQFRQLFASWQSLEKSQKPALAAVSEAANLASAARVSGGVASLAVSPFRSPSSVSIPSRIPVEGVHLTSDFGMRVHPVLGGRRMHKGIDLAAPVGTPVHATADGLVSRADWFSSYGLYVSIEHGGNIETRYGHMSRLNVAAGQQIHKGDIIGYVGTTGRSTGPHLHDEVRIAGEAVNPVPYLQMETFR